MATVTPQEAREAVASIFLSYMGRAPEFEAMSYYSNLYNELLAAQGDSSTAVDDAFKALSTDIYLSATANGEIPSIGGAFSEEDYVNWIYNNVLGREADADGLAYWTAQLESGSIDAPDLVAVVLEAARGDDRDGAYLANRTEVAVEYAKWENSNPAKFAENPQLSADIMEGVNEDPATVDAALQQLAGGDGSSGGTLLTVGVDDLVGTDGDDAYTAPLAQNQNGAVTNTFESGDSIDGQGGYDTLYADLTTVVSGGIPVGPAISSETNNVEEIHLRAQFTNLDVLGNFTTIDAEHNHGVEQWWSDNSRSSIIIEDVRTRPQETALGMRQTDTILGDGLALFGGPDFVVLFDPAQLSGEIDLSDSSLTLTLVNNDDPASELANFPVTGVVFNLDGEQYTVESDDMGAAATYADFVTALNAALAATAGTENLTASLNADNTITIEDPDGGTFVAVGYTWVDDIVPPGGNLEWSQVVGAPVETDIPITTTLYVDDVGRSDIGGSFIVGSMGTGGVEQFDVLVQRSSWLNELASTNNTLEIVNIAHDEGYDGDLSIGFHTREDSDDQYNIWTTTDDRLETNGLTDVRVLDATGFAGEMKIGAELTDDSYDKYLADATEPVQFSYLMGDGGSNLSLFVDDFLSGDPDFMFEYLGGAGDDRLNLYGAATKTGMSLDGGEGYNTLELWTSTGDSPDNAFASFENIQKLVIAGNAGTTQDFVAGNMLGLQEIVIANHSYQDTTLENLDASIDTITLSGKNQTLGAGNNNNFQELDDIDIIDAGAAEMTVVMDNTARLDAEFYVDSLDVMGPASAVRTLNIESKGERQTTNWLDTVNAALVTQLNLLGTQDLHLHVDSIGETTTGARTAFTVDGSALEGDLTLGLDGAPISASNAAGHSVELIGALGENDVLELFNTQGVTEKTTASGFETVEIYSGDGFVNATNISDVGLYDFQSLNGAFDLYNLNDTETVRISGGSDQDIHLAAAARSAGSQITVQLDPEFAGDEYSSVLSIENYRTVTLDLVSDVNTAFNTSFTLEMLGYEQPAGTENVNWARTLEITGGEHGPAFANLDTLELLDLSAQLTMIDLSAFKGNFVGSLGDILESDGATAFGAAAYTNTTVLVNGYDFEFDITHPDVANTVTVFTFTSDALDDTFDWTIDGFNAKNDGVTTLANVTILDVRELGITDVTAFSIVQAGADTVITSNDGSMDFEIILTGVTAADLDNDNFHFAV